MAIKFKQRQANKYKAVKTEIEGIKFDSKVEARYYQLLKHKGINFKCHESFEVLGTQKINGKTYRKVRYTPDFTIYKNNELIEVIDVKGGNATLTDAQKLRFKLFMDKYKVPVIIARYDYRTKLFVEEQV